MRVLSAFLLLFILVVGPTGCDSCTREVSDETGPSDSRDATDTAEPADVADADDAAGPDDTSDPRDVVDTSDAPSVSLEPGDELVRHYAWDETLHDAIDELAFDLNKATDSQTVFQVGEEDWNANSFPWGGPTILEDHEGHLRFYYTLGFPEFDEQNKTVVALQRSTDGGESWDKVRVNGQPSVVDHPDSNLISLVLDSGNTPVVELSQPDDLVGEAS